DKTRLEDTFAALIRRHESLRTFFRVIHHEPYQVVRDTVEFKIEEHTVESEEIPVDSNPVIRPFDLSTAPLMRVGLIAVNPNKYLLVVDMHHIISDGASIDVLITDFKALYNEEEPPAPGIQYKDFCQWQNNHGKTEAIKRQESYWLELFSRDIPVLDIPMDYPRPLIQRLKGRSQSFDIIQNDYHGLKLLAQREGVTLFMVLISLFTILLSKLSGQEDIVVGIPIAGRRHADLESIIGMFVNTLALMNSPIADTPFNLYLKEVKDRTIQAFENQDYLFEDLVRAMAGEVERDTSRNPLFDVMFSMQNFSVPNLELPGLTFSSCRYENRISRFDLTLTVNEGEEQLYCEFEYSTDLFEPESILRFTGYFKTLLIEAVNNDSAKLKDLDILPEEEKSKILFDFNHTRALYPGDKSIHRVCEDQGPRTPDGIALTGNGAASGTGHADSVSTRSDRLSLTYKQLNQRADALASLLNKKGIGSGSIIGIIPNRSVEILIGLLGILKAGCAYLPIDPQTPQERIDFMLRDSQASLLFSCQSVKTLIPTEGEHGLETVYLDSMES
ncbi:MAG: AMP-binding protein, partial [bacterium]|nr:AMP-binding protein [bacterium]